MVHFAWVCVAVFAGAILGALAMALAAAAARGDRRE